MRDNPTYTQRFVVSKELFKNDESGYRVLSCKPVGMTHGMELSKYHTFTLSGSNLQSYQIGEEYGNVIMLDAHAKYPASYISVAPLGVNRNGEAPSVSPEQELDFLKTLMTPSQAENVNEAYPNFVNLVLSGKQDEIDHTKIKNVAAFRLTDYIQKVNTSAYALYFLTAAKDLGYNDQDDVKKLVNRYQTVDKMYDEIRENPYGMYMDTLGFSFPKADKIIMYRWADKWGKSYERCDRACAYVCERWSDNTGGTWLTGSEMFKALKEVAPQCAGEAMNVAKNSQLLHYDQDRQRIGLESLYRAEEIIAEQIKMRLDCHCEQNDWDIEQYRNVSGFNCTDEQMKILELARDNMACILCGSAGTGKSASTLSLVSMLIDNHKSFALVAPTGIAAKRLSQATHHHASTIHMFLLKEHPDHVDYLIIDEFSMVGVELFSILLMDHSIDETTRLVFVCDNAQLASINPGNIIQDMLDSNVIPTAKLTKVFRYGIGGVATIATDVRNGKMFDADMQWDDTSIEQINDDTVQQVLDTYGKVLSNDLLPSDILVLSPMKIGDYGTYKLNESIQKAYGSGKTANGFKYEISTRATKVTVQFEIGDKVINIKNNYNAVAIDKDGMSYTTPIMNGDIGTVTRIVQDDIGELCLAVQFDNDEVLYTKKELKNLQLGYALTCHKTQGQQANSVIFLAHPSHEKMLTRNLMYVAITRAQKDLTIICDSDTIEAGLEKVENTSRNTYLKEMLLK